MFAYSRVCGTPAAIDFRCYRSADQRLEEEPLRPGRIAGPDCDSAQEVPITSTKQASKNSLPDGIECERVEDYLTGYCFLGRCLQENSRGICTKPVRRDTDSVNVYLRMMAGWCHGVLKTHGHHPKTLLRYVHFEPG